MRGCVFAIACFASAAALPAQALPKLHIDRSSRWFNAAESAGVSFDIVTSERNFSRGDVEGNPVISPITGNRPGYAELSAFGAAEVAGVSWFVARHPKYRWIQVALTAVHVGAGAWNLSREIKTVPVNPPAYRRSK